MNDDRSNSPDDVSAMAQAYCDGTLTAAEQEQLEALLRGDEGRQRLFLSYVDIHARLCWEAGHGSSSEGSSSEGEIDVPTKSWWLSRGFVSAAAAAAVFFVLIFAGAWWSRARSTGGLAVKLPAARTQREFVTVMNAAGIEKGQMQSVRTGQTVELGILELPQGVVELGYASGVRLLVESPAKLELIDGDHLFLHSGRLVAHVPHGATGFVVETQRARIKDLGTEFGISVPPEGGAQVQVYEGIVDTTLKDGAGKDLANKRLNSGQGRDLDTAAGSLAFVPQRFLRSFPVTTRPSTLDETLASRSDVEAMHAGLVATAPVIDGDLREWDRGRMFTSRCLGPNGNLYYVEGMMTYDAERIYIAAHVGDPAPMNSMVDYEQDPSFFWTGGSIVVRVAAGKSFGWPVNVARQSTSHEATAKDASEQIVHIGMWYSRRLNAPQLVLQYGMDCHNQTANPTGWNGAYRKDADGLGYTMEYAIDRSLLHADVPPEAGDVWPACWTVHWSDAGGRTCMGQLTEITNHSEAVYKTFEAKTWGRIVFDGR